MAKRKRSIPKELFEATIEALSHDGRGIARIDGKVHFIFGALPGERVRFRYLKIKSKFSEGITEEVLEPSLQRNVPPCPYFGSCGGCTLQHVKPDFQVKFKEQTLVKQLDQFGNLKSINPLPPITGPVCGYRRSARLGIRLVPKKGGVLVGFRERNSHYIQDMDACVILEPDISDLIPDLKQLIGSLSIPDRIPQIEVYRADNGNFFVIRHLEPLSRDDLDILTDFERNTGVFLYLQPGGPETIHPLLDSGIVPYYELNSPDLRLEFSPGNFIQINRIVNQKLIHCAIEFLELDDRDIIIDCFCGIGNFSLPLAQKAQQVRGIEGEASMVERATHNARLNSISNVIFSSMDLTKDLDSLLKIDPKPNKVLLDPPRSGAKELCEFLALELRPDRIVYVSCNPSTFSRDAGLLWEKGRYQLKKVRICDMFPHTSHAETIGLFVKA
ncbi:RNA methyltransferase, TrmA family [Dissulfuribacter thermophilus]|uniref:RNA methyltransferase, TrmA family n=1 Tax=Dissulfuribacter thermophilus TaxID=1156395 RepID=A0A1B9F9M3_9BACT|nr:23S rRNA (uracil(1939)-C(5))-methyltransferase RlmD [Dissulfuribacter thermophilus]OCC16564.1 RNA methyltransferase, TrmA family [Dissulfuribacter thermophilus]